MKEKIKQAILSIVEEKRRGGDVLPYATSEEVARRLHEDERRVRAEAAKLKGIAVARKEGIECYYE